MNLIDTHSHLYDEAFDPDREKAFERARNEGVRRLLLPAIDSESHERLFDLCRRHPDRCTPMMGLHPTSVNENPRWREELNLVEHYLQSPPEGIPPFCAVGEIGLDLYWSREFREEQIEAFRRQIELALQYRLPIAVHTRDAWPETVEIIREYRGRGLRGVFHAFSDGIETYRALKACGDFLFGDDALHGEPQSGRLQKVLRKTREVRQRSEGARSDHVKRGKTQILHPRVMRAKIFQAQLNLSLLQKGDLFLHRVDRMNGKVRAQNRRRNGGQSPAASHVEKRLRFGRNLRDHRHESGRIEKMVRHHLGLFPNGRQIVGAVPTQKKVREASEERHRPFVRRQSQSFEPAGEHFFPSGHSLVSLKGSLVPFWRL